jgi:hypothetical protein
MLLKSIPAYSAEAATGGPIVNIIVYCMFLSLTQKRRIANEYNERLYRAQGMSAA